MNNLKLAAAIAVAIGGAQAANASPTVAACAAAGATLYVAGSSAAQPSFATALANDLFDAGGETTISATNGNFKAYCGAAKAGNGAGIATGTITTVYYRGEGGSVVGVLPIVSGKAIKELDISPAACQVAAPATTGTSAANGTNDSWGGCVTNHVVEMGISDLEPSVFVPPNYPSAYNPAVFGTASKAQLSVLPSIPLFQQTFGLYVNPAGLTLATPGVINLSRETAANILNGNYGNWNSVPDAATGNPVSSSSVAINLVNREAGSGTRTGATIEFLGTNCVFNPQPLSDPGPDGFATGDVLTTAAATGGSITYASIDNVKAGLIIAQLSGVAPSNLASAAGGYDWWFEATAQKGTITSPGGTGIYNFLVGGELAALATAPHAVDVNAIPNVAGNSATVPLTASTVNGKTIYINPFSRAGNSCNIPGETN